MDKLDGKSMNIVNDNIEKLKEIFPEVFSEDKIDFKKLEEELGKFSDIANERYNFTWNGKQEAKKIAQTPSTGTLRPCKEDSKDWDTTQNLYIEGDNLEVLKLLQKSYNKKVKMIYIDPPYNTGKDFVYKDNFKDNIKNYLELTGQVDSEGNRLSINSDTNGRYHSDWLSMMYPRLKLARNLLKDDGVIFISIDGNEVANIRKICDEIFGEDNFISEIIWLKGKESGNDNDGMGEHHEYIVMYGKSSLSKKIIKLDKKDKTRHITVLPEKNYVISSNSIYKNGELFQLINLSKQKDYSLKIPLKDGTIIEWEGYCPQSTIDEYIKIGKVFVGEKRIPYIKSFLSDEKLGTKPSTIFEQSIGTTKSGGIEIKNLFNGHKIFSYPKPSSLIYRLLEIVVEDKDIVLDFFSGSATTLNAIYNYNIKKNFNIQGILVQLPELLDVNNGKNKKEKKTIQLNIDILASINKKPYLTEIGKERIKRAGEKIKEDNQDKDLSNLDIGFKVFKLDSSNIKEWDSDFENMVLELSKITKYNGITTSTTQKDYISRLRETNIPIDYTNMSDNEIKTKILEYYLESQIENIKKDRTTQDLLYEILLKYGLDLTIDIQEKIINDKKVFIVGFGKLIVCLDDNITTDIVEKIAQFKEELQSETIRVVFKDSGFKDSVDKTNAIAMLKQIGIDAVVSV
jgi:adenine-specific DNA-methyltransferase